jgi:hypothetical protein
MAEWLKAHAWKACIRETVSRVRIPLSPPVLLHSIHWCGQKRQDYAFSERRACGLMTMAVSSYRYETRRSDEPLRTRLVELAREKPRFGYRRLHVLTPNLARRSAAS